MKNKNKKGRKENYRSGRDENDIKRKRRRETTSTSKHTAWVYLSSFSVEAYAKGAEIITEKSSLCVRERERKLRDIKKTGRKIVGMLKAYSKNTHNVDEDFFSFWGGWNWATVWLIPQKHIYVHKFLYKYSHRMSPTFTHKKRLQHST